jgi:hypothetical protein
MNDHEKERRDGKAFFRSFIELSRKGQMKRGACPVMNLRKFMRNDFYVIFIVTNGMSHFLCCTIEMTRWDTKD